jgi:hypothetical protein
MMTVSRTLFFVLFLAIFGSLESKAQVLESTPIEEEEEPKKPIRERFYFGGNLGAQFGDYTLINVAPLVGFKITDRWSIGTQATYSYVNIRYSNYRYEDNIYGGSLFSRYFIFENFFAHAATETLNGNWAGTGSRFNVNSIFVGGGYMYRIGSKAGFGITAMFNLLPSVYSPYRNPIINAGFTFGL